jgi:hypothetical protein
MVMKVPGLAVLLIFAAAWPASAQTEDTECRENPEYLVVQRYRDDGFADFLVKKKSSPSAKIDCAFSAKPKDFRPREREPYGFSFIVLSGHYLALEVSDTHGTQIPRVRIYDLDRQTVLQDIDDVFEIGNVFEAGEEPPSNGFEVWLGTTSKPTKENCAEYADEIGGDSSESQLVILRKATFDFASLKIVESSETKCVSWAD